MALREVLLTGSVPLKPASAVFENVSRYLGDVVRRMPDGEQLGWIQAIPPRIAKNEAFEPGRITRAGTVAMFANNRQTYRLKAGRRSMEVELGPLGFAENILDAYAQFHRMKQAGVIQPGVRLQATVAGPASAGHVIDLPQSELLPMMERHLAREIDAIVSGIPANDLAIQLDLAVEVEKEEFDRRPDAFDTPSLALKDLTMEETASSTARLADRVPRDVELGIHLCALWHVDRGGGQDLNVHVDYANLLARKIRRQIDYLHLPTTPEFSQPDFEPLRRLALHQGTKLFIGLLHAVDGLEGAKRRMTAARAVRRDFGVSHFCGLSQWGAGPETVAPMLELHHATAAL